MHPQNVDYNSVTQAAPPGPLKAVNLSIQNDYDTRQSDVFQIYPNR